MNRLAANTFTALLVTSFAVVACGGDDASDAFTTTATCSNTAKNRWAFEE